MTTELRQPSYPTRVALDHYLNVIALLGVGILVGYQHGWPWGVGTVVGLWLLVALTNNVLMSTGSWWPIRINRWLWIVVAYVVLLI